MTLPLVLDDVLVNFDSIRARQAAQVLRDYADLGNQVIMFTCHEHIMRMFHDISVQVRVLPHQGQPGEARVYVPEVRSNIEPARIVETVFIHPEPANDPPEPEPMVVLPEPPPAAIEVVPTVVEHIEAPTPEPVVQMVRLEVPKKPKKQPPAEPEAVPAIDHLWYELDPLGAIWKDADEAIPLDAQHALGEEETNPDAWWTHA